MTIGQRIKAERERQGLTIEELAKDSGIKPMNLERFESGYFCPSWQVAERIIESLGLTVELKPAIKNQG